MDSDGIKKGRTGKMDKAPVHRDRDNGEWPGLAFGFDLFGADDRQIHDEFLDASGHQVPVEWVLQHDRRAAGHDPEPGGCGGDGSHFPQFRSTNGAEVPRGVASTRRCLGSRSFRYNSLGLDFEVGRSNIVFNLIAPETPDLTQTATGEH